MCENDQLSAAIIFAQTVWPDAEIHIHTEFRLDLKPNWWFTSLRIVNPETERTLWLDEYEHETLWQALQGLAASVLMSDLKREF